MTVDLSSLDDSILKKILFNIADKKDIGATLRVCRKWHDLTVEILEKMKIGHRTERALPIGKSVQMVSSNPTTFCLMYKWAIKNYTTKKLLPLQTSQFANCVFNSVLGYVKIQEGTSFYLLIKNCNDVAASVIFDIKIGLSVFPKQTLDLGPNRIFTSSPIIACRYQSPVIFDIVFKSNLPKSQLLIATLHIDT